MKRGECSAFALDVKPGPRRASAVTRALKGLGTEKFRASADVLRYVLRRMKVLVTGSSGLIGSEAVVYFDGAGHRVFGLGNNMRRDFFGPAADTRWNQDRLVRDCRRFSHVELDIR